MGFHNSWTHLVPCSGSGSVPSTFAHDGKRRLGAASSTQGDERTAARPRRPGRGSSAKKPGMGDGTGSDGRRLTTRNFDGPLSCA